MMRGEIWWVDFGLPFGSEPGFKRPAVIIQADAFNQSKINTVIIVPLTTNLALARAPGNIFAPKEKTKLRKDSVAVISQIAVIDKKRLLKKHSKLGEDILNEIEEGLLLILGLNKIYKTA
ncbi:MAG: type II toxin-antitoxin system PemK/MazF family toxin [Candidatus Margulisbacteria bacterium]|jgi:mRNA interferase MazF|nr:type II toxin-antitoxin system PemK/MazF family toxin [Candidatus Margulisiibacteriota bacterium]